MELLRIKGGEGHSLEGIIHQFKNHENYNVSLSISILPLCLLPR